MTNEQILKKAIEKANKNGWDFDYLDSQLFDLIDKEEYYRIIFNHNFAKAFWGIEWKDGDNVETPMSEILAQENIKKWQYHLRQMVLESNPLSYLAKFL